MKIIKYLINYGNKQAKSKIESEYIALLNRYIILISLIFFGHSLVSFSLNVISSSIATFVASILIFCTIFTRLKRNRTAVTLFYILLIVSTFIDSLTIGFSSGVSLYYIPILLSLGFVFDFRKDAVIIALLVILILLELFIIFLVNRYAWYTSTLIISNEVRKSVFYIVMMDFVFLLLLTVFFIYKKERILLKYYENSEEIETELSSIQYVQEIHIDELNELIPLATATDPAFYAKFQTVYPTFTESLVKIAPKLSAKDLEFCAYHKLNFTTKEIAIYTKNTVRAVESKKYRIRRKLDIPKEEDMNDWMMNLK